jgi:hypothetical protein
MTQSAMAESQQGVKRLIFDEALFALLSADPIDEFAISGRLVSASIATQTVKCSLPASIVATPSHTLRQIILQDGYSSEAAHSIEQNSAEFRATMVLLL